MKSHTHYLWFNTKRRQEIIDITDEVMKQVEVSTVREGLALVSAMHISASVFVNDHESGLWEDILKWLEGTIAPWDPQRYRHNETGEDNAAAHLRSLTIGHDVIVPAIERVEIGHTWYGQSRQRTHVNTTCKLLLLTHAFEKLGCKVVGLRTDNFNFRSQRAIDALGAKKDGVIRHFGSRRDGSVRDVVMYSILAGEWPDVKRHLELRLRRHKREAE